MSIMSHGQASPVTSEMPYLAERVAQRTIGDARPESAETNDR